VSEPSGKGLPVHILVTDELVDKAMAHNPVDREGMRRALSAVAPELFSAGMRAAIRLGTEEQSGTGTQDGNAERETGPEGGYEIGPSGEVRPAE
jgi:hypothetical protein